MADVSSSDLAAAMKSMFGSVSLDASMLTKCAHLCNVYEMPASEVLAELDAFRMNNSSNSTFGASEFGRFEQIVHKSRAAKKASGSGAEKRKSSGPSPIVQPNTKRSVPFTPGDSMSSVVGRNVSSISPASADSAAGVPKKNLYNSRTDNGQKVSSHNASLGERGIFNRSTHEPLGMRCRINTQPSSFANVKDRYRYMFTELEERAAALERHMSRLESDMRERAAISELHPVGVPNQETVWVCGRVCNEAATGKLNKTSVVLEGSRQTSGGRSVVVDLSETPSYALFPGQIVMAEGVNANGRKMNVKRLIEGVPRPLPTTSAKKLLEFQYSASHQAGRAIDICVAAGPFTTSDDLDFAPLNDLLVRMLEKMPDVVVLTGPFVDITHPMLAEGDCVDEDGNDISYERLFIQKFCNDGIEAFFQEDENSHTNFILVPSLNDAHHEQVFPQPPFGDREKVESDLFDEALGTLKLPFSRNTDPRKRVHLVPNPCMFEINEVLFGTTSNDALFMLSSDEISEKVPGARMERIAAHFLRQQSFFPMFPVPTSTSVQLDLRHSKHWTMDKSPDVLILPSKLATLATDVHGTLVINPGTLARGTAGGTFAEVSIHPLAEDVLRDALLSQEGGGKELPHSVVGRTSVNIIKI